MRASAATLPARASLFGTDLAQRHQRNGGPPYAVVEGIAVKAEIEVQFEVGGQIIIRGAVFIRG